MCRVFKGGSEEPKLTERRIVKFEIKNKWTGSVLFSIKTKTLKLALEVANLGDANLRGADLRDADLGDIKNYKNIHEIFYELTRKENRKNITELQWADIGKICIHRLCWDSIVKLKNIKQVFEMIAEKGFGEYLEEFINQQEQSGNPIRPQSIFISEELI